MNKVSFGATIDVKSEVLDMPGRYEDRYGHYLKFFQHLAESEFCISLHSLPATWAIFARYLGHRIASKIYFFDSCAYVEALDNVKTEFPDQRLLVEAVSTFRPELVDALWKYDMQWKSIKNSTCVRPLGSEILITNNGSYHRPEIQGYFEHLHNYTPTKKKVVLVPCAADKPYPAPLHSDVLSMMPSDFYLANITGVIGVVPQDLWPVMPQYDSGIPNEWRLVNIARDYFKRTKHTDIIVYIDFYSQALLNAFQQAFLNLDNEDHPNIQWVNPVQFYADYLDLRDSSRLSKLGQAFQRTTHAEE